MTTLNLAPQGFKWLKNRFANSPNYAQTRRWVNKANTQAIAFGDPVICAPTTTGGNYAGYVAPYVTGGSHILGIFAGIADGYYDTSLQQYIRRSWIGGTEQPSDDIPVWVIEDPAAVFQVQLSGGPLVGAAIGKNIDVLAGTAGTPNISGISTALLDYTTLNTTSTLPFRIVDFASGLQFGVDPTNFPSPNTQPINGWVQVVMNPGACDAIVGTGQ